MIKLAIAAIIVASLSGFAGASEQTTPVKPISKTIIGDSYTAYEASKICASELFFVPSQNHPFIYVSDSTQSWALSFNSIVQLSTGNETFSAKLESQVVDDKIHITIDGPVFVGKSTKQNEKLLHTETITKLLEDKLYDAYESYMICLSDF